MEHQGPIKIAQVASYYTPALGGVTEVVRYLCVGLAARGHEVHVFTSNCLPPGQGRVELPASATMDGVHVHRLRSYAQAGHLKLFPAVYAALRDGGFDVIHTHSYRRPHGELASWAARRAGVPSVLHLHGGFDPAGAIKGTAYATYDALARLGAVNRFNRYVALTPRHEACLRALGIPDGDVVCIPNAASASCFDRADSEAFLAAHDLAGRNIVLFLGMLHPAKRPDLLVSALPSVVAYCPSTVFVLAGPDAGARAPLTRQLEQLGVSSSVRLTGPLFGPDKHAALSAATVVCLPSDEDAFPIVAIEAAAHAKPLVLSDAVGTAGLFLAHGAASVFSRGRADQLAQRIAWLLDNPSTALIMGQRGRRLAVAEFSENVAVDRVERLYRSVLSAAPRRSARAVAVGAPRGGEIP